ncbi:hypothetical protein KR054_001723 [Drosophila jambulina]|nr:hypothetical protein KR054_001723 [Drosophila jambulina]
MTSRKSFVGIWTAPRDSNTAEMVDDYRPGSVRPVLFVFYTLETVFNMFCLAYHISGFQSIEMDMFGMIEQLIHGCYLCIFYVFMVITLFQSINLCTGHSPKITIELIKTSSATIAFLFVSLATMWDAERQFYMFSHDPRPSKGPSKFVTHDPVHPFFLYMRSQSISALACGVLYLLHTCLMLDYKLTTEWSDNDYMPISLYVFGRWVHTKLESYKWFQDFASYEKITI